MAETGRSGERERPKNKGEMGDSWVILWRPVDRNEWELWQAQEGGVKEVFVQNGIGPQAIALQQLEQQRDKWREAYVRELLADVYTPEGIEVWLNARQRRFEGLSPLAMLKRDPPLVFDVIEQMRTGTAT